MTIRHALISDIDAVAQLEADCFVPTEAASWDRMNDRVRTYPECIWLDEREGHIVSFVIALRSDLVDLIDDMFASASLHDGEGAWLHVLSVATAPDMQGQGIAAALVNRAIHDSLTWGIAGSVLTCKPHLVGYYQQFGYVDEGVCDSEHGGVVWHQMRLTY